MAQLMLGELVLTCNIMELQQGNAKFADHILRSLQRYTRCDWGEMDDEGKEMNDSAIGPDEDEVLAVYEYPENPSWEIMIMTKADRSATIILFPNEY